jgi:hypothetical protein
MANMQDYLSVCADAREASSPTHSPYCKPTDSHSYLMYDSAHPQRCKDSIPYGQFLRIRRICSQECDYEKHVIELTAHFFNRGYPITFLEEASTLAEAKNRGELIEEVLEKSTNSDGNTDKVMLITQYNPNFQDLRKITYGNWDMLGKSPTTEFIYEKKLMCAYRRPKNLRDLLVRANIPFKEGDDDTRPNRLESQPNREAIEEAGQSISAAEQLHTPSLTQNRKQKSILDFFAPVMDRLDLLSTSTGV